MILCHGSNIEIGEILLSKGRHGKDFGRDSIRALTICRQSTATDRQFLIESLCEDIVPMIMEEYQLTDKEAFDKLYKSTTFSKVEDPETGLYYQCPVYVFVMLKEELRAAR